MQPMNVARGVTGGVLVGSLLFTLVADVVAREKVPVNDPLHAPGTTFVTLTSTDAASHVGFRAAYSSPVEFVRDQYTQYIVAGEIAANYCSA